jgi:hypothetical protein
MKALSQLRILASVIVCFPALAFAEVGTIAVMDGSASRTPKGGKAEALKVGASVEVADTIEVQKGHLKLKLNDNSVIALDQGSKLEITEAEFAGQERKGFSAKLLFGKLWTKVSKAVGGSKYEITTERAVAGVRGTIFRIDADTLVKAASGKQKKATVVRVSEGLFGVKPTATVAAASGKSKPLPKKQPKGERKEVPPPFQEISADDWEKKFAELQQNAQIAVGVDLWELAEYEQSAKDDAFSKWVDANQ